MREILFKAKRKDNNEWIEGNYVYGNGKYSKDVYITKTLEYTHQLIEVIPETICEYTGLKDKNGVKIFENDILNVEKRKMKVIFDKGVFCIKSLETDFEFTFKEITEVTYNIEAIGNIFDNK